MKIGLSGREFARWPIPESISEATPFSASFDGGETWQPMTRLAPDTIAVLVAGPDATDNPMGTVVLARGPNEVLVMMQGQPEVVVRDAGRINVVRKP